uniref:Uncharacterized protein n=1 Tax=Anguilla anguilla TaxID=7936 RepID=A0A0E9VMV7_ANGAN
MLHCHPIIAWKKESLFFTLSQHITFVLFIVSNNPQLILDTFPPYSPFVADIVTAKATLHAGCLLETSFLATLDFPFLLCAAAWLVY